MTGAANVWYVHVCGIFLYLVKIMYVNNLASIRVK